mgnify:CR=1 FL=1
MTTSIWLLFYDIAAADRDHYVDWFHRCHIPEKLARPGYRSAAHFEAPPLSSNRRCRRCRFRLGGVGCAERVGELQLRRARRHHEDGAASSGCARSVADGARSVIVTSDSSDILMIQSNIKRQI